MKTPTALSVTSSQREQTSLRSQVPRLPRSNVCSTRDLENRSASVHRKRFSTPSLPLKFLCAGKLNPRFNSGEPFGGYDIWLRRDRPIRKLVRRFIRVLDESSAHQAFNSPVSDWFCVQDKSYDGLGAFLVTPLFDLRHISWWGRPA